MAETKLSIYNAAPYTRGGHVEIPWSGEKGDLEVAIGNDVYPAQVDATEGQHGPSTLSFTVAAIPSGTHDAVVRPRTQKPEGAYPGAGEREGGVYLVNTVLDVWFSLSPDRGGLHCFASSAPTVQVHRYELLDTEGANKDAFRGHDEEKRAMQIDYVRMWRPPWDNYEPTCCEFPLFNEPWTLIGADGGPVRAWATLASPKFTFDVSKTPGGGRSEYNCSLQRTLSLYADANYILEDLRVQASGPAGRSIDLAFGVQYFMSAEFSLRPRIVHYPAIPDWFGIAATWPIPRLPAYAFGTTAHVTVVHNPPAAYPHEADHKAFSWRTEAAPRIRCGHLFRFEADPPGIADDAGKFWYLHLLEPLRAKKKVASVVGSAERKSA